MAHDVFISYSSKDKPAADAVCAAVEDAGVRCWIAPRDIKPGSDWSASIIEAIGRSRVFLLVFSRNSNASQDVQREVQHACDQGVVVVPFRVEDVEPTGGMKYFLGPFQWFDALPPPEPHYAPLAAAIKALLPVVPGPAQTSPPTPVARAPEPAAISAEAAPPPDRPEDHRPPPRDARTSPPPGIIPRSPSRRPVWITALVLLAACLALIGLLETTSLPSFFRAQIARIKLASARRALDAGRYLDAQNAYRSALAFAPDSPEATAGLKKIEKYAADEMQAGARDWGKNDPEAARHFKNGAELGNFSAQGNLAVMYYRGQGNLPEDKPEAARLFELSAAQGNLIALMNLASMYETGTGVRKDLRHAIELYRWAATSGSEAAKERLRGLGEAAP